MNFQMFMAEAEDIAATVEAAAQSADRWENVSKSLEIMGYGMAGIFITIFIIMIFVWILGRSGSGEEKK